MSLLYAGDESLLTCEVTDINGNLSDPGVVTANVKIPRGGPVVPLTVTRVSQGIYTAVYIWTTYGNHYVQFEGTLPFPFNQYAQFLVTPNPF